ncbi:MAG TPA: carbohydrate binding family 9 domain-containing protein, partial [Candidatus Polarisedimenticolia bacterium]|nr:carbohydrate binding family 9 domain-containing protein [Candidatus Polarisedimenticolia bacterium]
MMAPPRAAIQLLPAVLLLGGALGRSDPLSAPDPPIAHAVRAPAPVTVDGVLDEAAWSGAEPITSFTQRFPAEGSPASQKSDVRILFDDERLFIGAELYDSEPARIIAREMKEDADLSSDDAFGILLDTFHDRRNGFYFLTNPNGAKSDALVYDEGRNTSFDWDGIWEVACRTTERGWTVEMEIPFKTLHFHPDSTESWGLQIWRFIRRENEDVFWAPIPRNETLFRISRAGELRGLTGIRQGASLLVKPYALAGVGRRPTLDERSADGTADVGLDARYHVTPNLSAIVTMNTDFAETEVDSQQVNTTRFSLFFPEKREFFLESTGYFEFGYNRRGPGAPPGVIPFFSRRIGLDTEDSRPIPLQGGVKLAGRVGRYNIGFLSVNADRDGDNPQTNFSALRVSRDILTRSNWGIIGVSKEPAGPDQDEGDAQTPERSNRTYGADVNFSVLGNLKFGGSMLGTVTPGSDRSQTAGHAYVNWSDQAWVTEFSFRDIGQDFNPEVGFVQRVGIEELEGFLGWAWRSETGPVRMIEPHTRHVYTMDQNHRLATRRQHWATSVVFKDGSEIEVGYNPIFDSLEEEFTLSEKDSGDPEDDVLIRPGGYRMDQWLVLYGGDRSRVLSGSLFAEFGGFFDGDFRSAEVSGEARISRHLRSSISVQRTEINLPSRPADPSDPNIVHLPRSEFNFTLAQARLGVTFTTRI